MATTNYHTVNGEIIGETTSAARTGYLTDGLGSVTAIQSAAGIATATWRYKPFGAVLAKTGAAAAPRFLWSGSLGCRFLGVSSSDVYCVGRHYGSWHGTWTSRDPLWPSESSYGYVGGNPVTYADPFGLSKLTFRFGAFINRNNGEWFKVRFLGVSDGWEYRSDNRGPGEEGSYRVYTEAAIETSLLDTDHAVLYAHSWPGMSHRRKGGAVESMRSALEPPPYSSVSSKSGGCAASVIAKVAVTNPFKPAWMLGKYINYVINFKVSVLAPGLVSVHVHGKHDSFPDYELIVSFSSVRPWYHFGATPLDFEQLESYNQHVDRAAVVPADTPPECCY